MKEKFKKNFVPVNFLPQTQKMKKETNFYRKL